MSDVNKQRRDKRNVDRVFGGLNVLLSGDFHQLDPPSGTSLRALPCAWIQKARQYAPSATEDHGQQIMWGKGAAEGRSRNIEGCVQGVTELTQCVRVKDGDAWLLEVQREFREGALTNLAKRFQAAKIPIWRSRRHICHSMIWFAILLSVYKIVRIAEHSADL